MSLFSLRIRSLRKKADETQESVAKYLNVTRATYSAYEREVIVPSYDVIMKLAEKYDVSIDYLMGRTNYEKYDLSNMDIPDLIDQLLLIKDELSSDTSIVKCKGRNLTDDEKKKIVPFIESTINMIEVFTKESK